MLVRGWRWLTIMFTALSLAPALGHLLEMPAKMTYDGALWLKLQQSLYGAFGTFGGAFEMGAVITTIVLVILVRDRRPAFSWTLAAAICMVAANAAYWVVLAPINATIAGTVPGTLPTDWMGLRDQWEYTHAARAVLQMIALGALAFSVLAETPARTFRRSAT